ncbi:MAG: hypothetical protein R3E09_13335 [Novosphingobium sp.]|nr:hypothetical protein [Novosphingobium sp.]
MVDLAELKVPDEVVAAVEAIRGINPERIARADDLGRALAFTDAIAPMRKVVAFYEQIPVEHLAETSEQARKTILATSQRVLGLCMDVMAFDPTSENASQTREGLLQRLAELPESVFNELKNDVSYLASRQRDFSSLAEEARKARDEAIREADELRKRLEETEMEANRILDEVRKAASEQGVSQQAHYFDQEATRHETRAGQWQTTTVWIAIGLGVLAAGSVALAYWLPAPENNYQAFQVAVGKVLVFATIGYMLFLSAKTLTANRHNVIVNRHRRNALLTFNALVDASAGEESRDIVLSHAAACIFAPQESGFTKQATSTSGSPLVELLPKMIGKSG